MKNPILRAFQEESGRRFDHELGLTSVVVDIVEKVYWRKADSSGQKMEGSELLNQVLDEADKREFKEWIFRLIQTSNNDDVIGGLIFAYGKMCEETDIPFITSIFERFYKKIECANGPFSQCFAILNVYGKTKTNKGSWSFDDYGWNMKAARAYLNTVKGNSI